MNKLSCAPPGSQHLCQKGKKYIVLFRMGVYHATGGSEHHSFMHMRSDKNDCSNNEFTDLKSHSVSAGEISIPRNAA